MKRQIAFATSLVLALAAGTTSFTTTADAAVFRHHGGGHATSHFSGGHRYAFHRGYGHGHHWASGGPRGGYYGGYYGGGYYDYCSPVQLVLGLCAPYRSYGPFGLL